MPIHRTRTLENLSASSLSFSSKDSAPATNSDTSKRAGTSVSSHSVGSVSDETQPVKPIPLPGAEARLAQRNGGAPLQSGLTMFFATATLGPKVDQNAQSTLQLKESVATDKSALQKPKRKELRVNTKLPVLPGEGLGPEGDEDEIENLLLGTRRGTKRKWFLHGKTPKGIKRRRSELCSPSPRFQEDKNATDACRPSLLDELEGENKGTPQEPLQESIKDSERPCKLLRVCGEKDNAAVAPQLDVVAAVTSELSASIYPGVYALEADHFKEDQETKWTHIIHIETRKDKQDHSNFRDANDVHHIHLYAHSSTTSPLSLKDAQLRAGRDFLSLALPYSCSQAEDSHSFSEPPASWIDQRWDTEPSRVLIVFDNERLRDTLALVATFGVFDGAGSVEELMEHFMDAFPESATADAAREIWEDWRAVEKLKRASAVDMVKKPIRKVRPILKEPVDADEWE